MATTFNGQKQDAEKDSAPENVERDGFSAEEIGEASVYDSTTEIAQMMRRGDETASDSADRDVVGATDEATNTDNQPVPKHQNAVGDLVKNSGK